MSDGKTILVPTDLTEESSKVIEEAISFSEGLAHECRLKIVHVFEEHKIREYSLVDQEDSLKKINQVLEEELKGICSRIEEKEVSIEYEILSGDPAAMIIEESEKSDIVVMSKHCHSIVQKLLVGSVTEKVVRHADCHVLVIEPGSRGFFKLEI